MFPYFIQCLFSRYRTTGREGKKKQKQNPTVNWFRLLTCPGCVYVTCLAEATQRNVLASSSWPWVWPLRLVGTSGTRPVPNSVFMYQTNTCTNVSLGWHLFFFFSFCFVERHMGLILRPREQHVLTHTHTCTRTHRGISEAACNLEKALLPRVHQCAACLQQQNTHSLCLFILRERNLGAGARSSVTVVFLWHFPGTRWHTVWYLTNTDILKQLRRQITPLLFPRGSIFCTGIFKWLLGMR